VSAPSFSLFLEAKPLYYKEIDHLRVHRAYTRLKSKIRHPRTVHIVGTNGKGSTGRMIAHLAYQGAGSREQVVGSRFSVGHFSSPHILKFNERIWLDGQDVNDEVLEQAHQKLYSILGQEMSDTLSYFEYTTLLALVAFEQCDLMILEAGLGGEYDATNVCDKELSVITPIAIDHQAFLGDSVEAIAQTKIRSIQKRVLLAPQPYAEVIEVAKKIAGEKEAVLYWSVQSSGRMLHLPQTESEYLGRIVQSKGWPAYLQENAVVALQTLGLLKIPYEIDDLMSLELFGRFYPLAENIRIDVGHNPLAARAIAAALKEPVVLIYNSLDDKDYEAVLGILKPKVKRVEIIPIDSQRAATVDAIRTALERIGLPYSDFNGVIDREEHYLVFGSFYTVEAFIKKMKKGSNVSE